MIENAKTKESLIAMDLFLFLMKKLMDGAINLDLLKKILPGLAHLQKINTK